MTAEYCLLALIVAVVIFVIGYLRGRGIYVCQDCDRIRRAR